MLKDFKQIGQINFIAQPIIGSNDCSETIKELNKYLKKLNDCFKKDQNNFAELCFYVFKVHELFDWPNNPERYKKLYYGGLDSKQGRYTFDTIMREFGLDDSQVSRLINCYKNYVEVIEDKPKLKDVFFGFNKSKLITLLVVDTKQLELDIQNKVLRQDMSVIQLREYVKNYKAKLKADKKLLGAGLDSLIESINKSEEEIKEEDIPEAYNPKKHYDFSYFETKTKAQLLNIVWSLQEEYERLKNKNKK